MSDKRSRGRPKRDSNPKLTFSDEIIGLVCNHLIMNGEARDAVCREVGKAAVYILRRGSNHDLHEEDESKLTDSDALGADQIRVIYESWRKVFDAKKQESFDLEPGTKWMPRHRYTKESLKALNCVSGDLRARVDYLMNMYLQHKKGDSAPEDPVWKGEYGDPQLTPKQNAAVPKLRIRGHTFKVVE